MNVIINLPYQIRFVCAAESHARVHTVNSIAEGEAIMAYLTGKLPVSEFIAKMIALYDPTIHAVLYAFVTACSGVPA